MDRPCGGIDIRPILHVFCVIKIEQHEVAGLDAGKVAPLRIHKEFAAISRDGGAEVVRDSLVRPELGDDAECRCEINAELPFSRRRVGVVHLSLSRI
jgi:hypothetical protein